MSDYKVIRDVSYLLRQTLWDGFAGDVEVTQHVPTIDSIALTNPAEKDGGDDDRRLSLWLYQVQTNEFLRNARPTRIPTDPSFVRMPPLAINLFYLLTPSTKTPDGNQLLLGRSMQILHDNAALLLESAGPPKTAEEIRVSMCQRDLRELAEVWEALQQPYRLSVCYEVRVPRIESKRTEHAVRIDGRSFDFADNPLQEQGAL